MPATRLMLVLSLLVPTRSSSYMKDNDLLEAELARLERQIGTAAAVATSRHDSNATQKPMRCASMRLLHQPRRSVPRNVTSRPRAPPRRRVLQRAAAIQVGRVDVLHLHLG